MPEAIDNTIIARFEQQLQDHPIYQAVASLADLQVFMQHHVYSVWDFMSLIKYLQSMVAPTCVPWVPQGDADVRRFINELVLEEESDQRIDGNGFTSHFELYQGAMLEVGASVTEIRQFIDCVSQEGIDLALQLPQVPVASAAFTRRTFDFLQSGQAHEVAAALALGREHIIPGMFRAILARIGVPEVQAPTFHAYLNRHIHLDEDFHAPLSLRLLNGLCGDDPAKREQAIAAAEAAVQARLAFWDGVLEAIELAREPAPQIGAA